MRDLKDRQAVVNHLSRRYRSYVGFLVKWPVGMRHNVVRDKQFTASNS